MVPDLQRGTGDGWGVIRKPSSVLEFKDTESATVNVIPCPFVCRLCAVFFPSRRELRGALPPGCALNATLFHELPV
jgi:hypothetical protein